MPVKKYSQEEWDRRTQRTTAEKNIRKIAKLEKENEELTNKILLLEQKYDS